MNGVALETAWWCQDVSWFLVLFLLDMLAKSVTLEVNDGGSFRCVVKGICTPVLYKSRPGISASWCVVAASACGVGNSVRARLCSCPTPLSVVWPWVPAGAYTLSPQSPSYMP